MSRRCLAGVRDVCRQTTCALDSIQRAPLGAVWTSAACGPRSKLRLLSSPTRLSPGGHIRGRPDGEPQRDRGDCSADTIWPIPRVSHSRWPDDISASCRARPASITSAPRTSAARPQRIASCRARRPASSGCATHTRSHGRAGRAAFPTKARSRRASEKPGPSSGGRCRSVPVD